MKDAYKTIQAFEGLTGTPEQLEEELKQIYKNFKKQDERDYQRELNFISEAQIYG